MNRQAQKIVSTAVTLVLILAPMETMYASQEQQCGEPEVVLVDSISEKHAHIIKKLLIMMERYRYAQVVLSSAHHV
ncbi:MAG TPA: hypothetical protein VIQ81_13030 [Gammaproteobacteria bacterium]